MFSRKLFIPRNSIYQRNIEHVIEVLEYSIKKLMNTFLWEINHRLCFPILKINLYCYTIDYSLIFGFRTIKWSYPSICLYKFSNDLYSIINIITGSHSIILQKGNNKLFHLCILQNVQEIFKRNRYVKDDNYFHIISYNINNGKCKQKRIPLL